jgi:hypothetical protein
MVPFGLAFAVCARVGAALGAGQHKQAKLSAEVRGNQSQNKPLKCAGKRGAEAKCIMTQQRSRHGS